MNLYTSIQQSILDDLDTLKEEHAQQIAAVKSDYKQQLNELNQEYRTIVQEQINQKVNLSTHTAKQEFVFKKTDDMSATINTAYRNILPQLLKTTFLKEQLQKFFADYDAKTPLTVSGSHATELKNILTEMGYTSPQEEKSEGLGNIVYQTATTQAEFSIEDFLKDVQTRTIDKVMNLFKSND